MCPRLSIANPLTALWLFGSQYTRHAGGGGGGGDEVLARLA